MPLIQYLFVNNYFHWDQSNTFFNENFETKKIHTISKVVIQFK